MVVGSGDPELDHLRAEVVEVAIDVGPRPLVEGREEVVELGPHGVGVRRERRAVSQLAMGAAGVPRIA